MTPYCATLPPRRTLVGMRCLLAVSTLTAVAGGAETTSAAVTSFFLAMAMYPDVQKRAQAEVDGIVGPDRLPTFSDRTSLPYVNAIVSEVLRWQPVAPLGKNSMKMHFAPRHMTVQLSPAFPHTTVSDDEYRGYFIPSGTTFVANAWFVFPAVSSPGAKLISLGFRL